MRGTDVKPSITDAVWEWSETQCGEVYTRFTDHSGALGVLLFSRKKSIALL
jgi:hypothetical protein